MSSKSKRLLDRTQKSSMRNSPLVTPSSADSTSKNSVAFGFESESINSSLSSVFSNNEEFREKKKKTGRTRKIRNTEDLRDCFKEPDSTDSVSDLETASKKIAAKSTKSLAEIPLSASRNSRKKRKPIFTLPDMTGSFKFNSIEIADETVTKKGKHKKKIRYTEDLNAISNHKRESDVAVKCKSKKTKKARLPSFLPTVDMIDESKKLSKLSDNKENDTNTESTDTEENFRKTKRGRSRKAKKKMTTNEQKVTLHIDQEEIFKNDHLDNKNNNRSTQMDIVNNEEINTTILSKSILKQSRQSENKSNLSIFEKSIKDPKVTDSTVHHEVTKYTSGSTEQQSTGESFIFNTKVDRSLIIVNVMGNENNISEDEPSEPQMQLDQKRSVGKRKSKRNTFEVFDSPNKKNESINLICEMAEDRTELVTTRSKLRSTFNLSDEEGPKFHVPNKSGNTSDFENECMDLCSEISQEQNEADTYRKSVKRVTTAASMVEEASKKLDASPLFKSRRSTRNLVSNRTIESIPNQESFRSVCESNESAPSLIRSQRTSKALGNRSTFESISSVESSNKIAIAKRSTRGSRSVAKSSTFDVSDSVGKTLESEREGTFEVHTLNIDDPFEQGSDDNDDIKGISRRDTYDLVPPSCSKSVSADDDDNKSDTVIDLTESLTDDTEPSSSKKPKRSTFTKDTLEKRKSSFEVSFKRKIDKNRPEEILDHLNITRRDSRKSKKSSAGFKYSTGSDVDDIESKGNFVTLTRGCRTMIDFNTRDSWNDLNGSGSGKGGLKKFKNLDHLDRNGSEVKIVLKDDKSSPEATGSSSSNDAEAKANSAPRKSILKKSIGATTRSTRRDTFEIVEGFYEIIESRCHSKPTVSLITEDTPNVTVEPQPDIFDIVSRTPTAQLGHMMIGSGESVIMGQSFLHDTNLSVMPRLTRTSTFTKNEVEESPKPTRKSTRKSTRKRWSQVERTPIFNRMPNGDSSVVADQPTDTTQGTTINKSKSVTIKTPPNFSPRKRWNDSLKTTPRETKATEKGKKSVKIETPVKTPKIRLHSPLVIRKTPKPDFNKADSSILSGNCAYKPSTRLTPPSQTSTPYPKKKEVSLLQKVLTSEKNKSGKSIAKNSVRSKAPNFAKIHQRQYDKLESLKEMQERKAVRAQFLLSGSKPPANTSAHRVEEKESRKQLKFSPKKTVPSKMASDTRADKANTSKPISKPRLHMLNKRASLEKQKKQIKSKVPVAVTKPIVVPTGQPQAPPKPEQKCFTRFGFKMPSGKENVTKDEQIKAVTTKSKITGNRTETNRKQLGGVRSNRRFELLMQMRQNKNKLPANTVSSGGIKYKYETRTQGNRGSIKANPSKNVTKPSGLKSVPKPLQHMLNKAALKEKKENQGKSKIPAHACRSKRTLRGVLKRGLDLEARGFTRFGFKLPLGKVNVTKKEQIKAVSTKSKIIRDRTEENRNELKKVRSNRRFELLMKMRESNK